MRVACLFLLATAFAVIAARPAAAGPDDGGGPPLIPGSRQVHIRNASGGLGVHTSIPSGSAFRSHGGGSAAECRGVTSGDDPNTLGIVEETHAIRSQRWIFIEGVLVYDRIPEYIDIAGLDSRPRLADARRTFSVYCADTSFASNQRGFIQVAATDPMLDPRPRLTNLYNGLQLENLVVYENAVVDRWGGLVVRNPAWLAINGSSWSTQRSNVEYWRGWELYLIAQPVALEFLVDFDPDPDRPSAPFSGVVECVARGDTPPAAARSDRPTSATSQSPVRTGHANGRLRALAR